MSEQEIITEAEMIELENGTGAETGRVKQLQGRLAALRKDIEKDKESLAKKEEQAQQMAKTLKEGRKRTHALCQIAGNVVKISGLEWSKLNQKGELEKWLDDIKAEAAKAALEKYQAEHPVPDLDKVRAEAVAQYQAAHPEPDLVKIRQEAIEQYIKEHPAPDIDKIKMDTIAEHKAMEQQRRQAQQPNPNPAARPMVAVGGGVRSAAVSPR